MVLFCVANPSSSWVILDCSSSIATHNLNGVLQHGFGHGTDRLQFLVGEKAKNASDSCVILDFRKRCQTAFNLSHGIFHSWETKLEARCQ